MSVYEVMFSQRKWPSSYDWCYVAMHMRKHKAIFLLSKMAAGDSGKLNPQNVIFIMVDLQENYRGNVLRYPEIIDVAGRLVCINLI